MVTIEIPDGKKSTAHAHLLAHYSEYFCRALKSGMQEASSLHFCLTEHANNGSVSLLINWLYDPKLYTSWDWDGDKPSPDLTLKAWLLADYLQVRRLQNYLVNQLLNTHPSSTDDQEAYAASQNFLPRCPQARRHQGPGRIAECTASSLPYFLKAFRTTQWRESSDSQCLECLIAMQWPLLQNSSQNTARNYI